MIKLDKEIYGEGKGGGGGSAPTEEPDNLRTYSTAMILAAIGEGPIQAVNELYFDDTAVSAYPYCGYEVRNGESTQSVIPGFAKVSSITQVNGTLTKGNYVTRDVSTSEIDDVVVTLQADALVQVQDDGDMVGYSVKFRIQTSPYPTGSGSAIWTTFQDVYLGPGKSASAPVQRMFAVDKPNNAPGIWSVRIQRLTNDDSSSKTQSTSRWTTMAERQHHKLSYDNTALAGIHADAKSTGGGAPRTSFDVSGLKIKIPSNYDPATKTYTGSWDGLFKTGVHYTTNPAWVVYDLLTNTRYGLGLDPATIDKYSFYNAGVYNDGQLAYVTSTGISKTTSRFTFNGVIQAYDDGYSLIQSIASCCRAQIIDMGGLVTLLQDRPYTGTPMVFTNNNVIDGHFEYISSGLQERHTQVNVTWNDPSDRYLQKIVTVPHTTDTTYDSEIAKYQYNPIDLAAIGCTDEGQAYRLGKWQLDTDLKSTNMVSFKVSLQNAFVMPGDVISVMDEFWSGTQQSARIVSATLTSVTLDRAITIPSGLSIITMLNVDGSTYISSNLTNSNGTFTTFNLATPLVSLPTIGSSTVISTAAIVPQLYRVAKIALGSMENAHLFDITATQYDANKYTRIDSNTTVPYEIFKPTSIYSVAAPTSASAKIIGVMDAAKKTSSNTLELNWQPGDTQPVTYTVRYSYENNTPIDVKDIPNPSFSISNAKDGLYTFYITATNRDKITSNRLTYTATLGKSDKPDAPPPLVSGSSSLNPPTNLFVKGTTGYAFTTADFTMTFTNPNTIGYGKNTLKDFILEVWNASNTTLLKTVIISPIEGANTNTEYTYTLTLAENASLNGGIPSRTLPIRIYARDTLKQLSTAATAIFTNGVPAAVSCLVDSAATGAFVRITPASEADVAGYIVWRSTTANFTAYDSTTQVYDGKDSSVALYSDPGTTYYYRCAAYDFFGKTGLNVSGQTTSSTPSQAKGPVNYAFSGLTFTPNSPSVNVCSWTGGQVVYLDNGVQSTYSITAGNASWAVGSKTYIYYQKGLTYLQSTTNFGAAMSADNIVLAVYNGGTDLQVGNGKPIIDGSTLIAGSVGANQIVAGYVDAAILNSNTAFIKDVNIRDTISSVNYNGTNAGWRLDKNGNITTFGALTVKDTVGGTVLDTSGVSWGKVTGAGRPADNATVNNGLFANLNGPITPSNITTYISHLAVSSLQIDGNAVVIPVAVKLPKTRFTGALAVKVATADVGINAVNGYGWFTIASASIDMTISGASTNNSKVILTYILKQHSTSYEKATAYRVRIIDEADVIHGTFEGEYLQSIPYSDGAGSSFPNINIWNYIDHSKTVISAAQGPKTYRLQIQATGNTTPHDLTFSGSIVLMGAKKNG